MIINHNLGAMNAIRNMNINSSNASKSMQKLSSGLKINGAADDAAGLAISEKMKGQIRGLDQASANSQDAISLTQTAEGALSETQSILQRMRELAVQSSNDTNNDDDRKAIQTEMNQLTSEINRIGNTTEFNTKKLLNGTISSTAGIVTASSLVAGSGAASLSNLSLDSKGSLVAGNYKISIADTTTKSANNTADATFTALSIDQNSKLDTGNYKIDIQQSQVKGATLATPVDGVTAVAINPLSTETVGTHAVAITRTDSVSAGAFTGTNTGLTANGVSVTSSTAAGASGTYIIETAAKLSTISAGTSTGTSALMTLNLDDNGALGNAAGYRLAYADEGSGIYSVQLQDNTGAAVSDKVILDNNVQHYDFQSSGAKIGISFDTATGINAALTAATADGMYDTFDVSTELTLKQGGVQVGTTANIAAGSIAGNSTIGDFTIAHGAANTLINGKSDSFAVTNTLTATIDGTDSHTFSAGGTINFADGVNVTTSNDITKYSATAPESYNVTIGATDSYTATVKTSGGAAVTGAQTVTVDAAAGGSYNLGNGVEFTLAAGQLTAATSHNFTVDDTITTNATLTNTSTSTTVATKNVTGAGTIDFGSGLKVDVADKSNGDAAFSVTGGHTDESLTMQIGANNGQTMSIGVDDMRSIALGISSGTSGSTKSVTDSMGNHVTASYTITQDVTNGTNNSNVEYALDVNTADKATAAISVLDSAISTVSAERSKLGAVQNRLEHTINNLGTASQNLTSAQSRIADVDMAKEMSEFSKNNILSQAAQAMLAQANQQPQQVLQLLR